MPHIDESHDTHSVEEQRAYYARKGIVFVDDEWSLWHIRVWANSRESNGYGVSVNADVVFRYASKFGMDDIETFERVKNIERGASSE